MLAVSTVVSIAVAVSLSVYSGTRTKEWELPTVSVGSVSGDVSVAGVSSVMVAVQVGVDVLSVVGPVLTVSVVACPLLRSLWLEHLVSSSLDTGSVLASDPSEWVGDEVIESGCIGDDGLESSGSVEVVGACVSLSRFEL